MKLRDVGARQGVIWVRSGFRIFFRHPLGYAALFASFLAAALLCLALPAIGPLLVLTALPLVSLGFMLATQGALQGRTPVPAVFVVPLRAGRSRRRAMLQLGLAYAVGTLVILWLSDAVDGGRFRALQEATAAGIESSKPADLGLWDDPRLQAGMWLRFVLASLLSLPFWHAPALVHWGGLGPAKALFASTLACWRNKAAFAVFGVTWAGLLLLFGTLVDTLLLLLGQTGIVAAAAVPAALLFATVFYASLFFTFVDCFEPAETVAAESA